jgi:hypothetical protein
VQCAAARAADVHAASVVADRDRDAAVGRPPAHGDVARFGVPDDVRDGLLHDSEADERDEQRGHPLDPMSGRRRLKVARLVGIE